MFISVFQSWKVSHISLIVDQVLSGEDGMVGWSSDPESETQRWSGFLELLNSSAEFNPCMI